MTIKVMRAENWIPKKVKFPVWAEPKIDGVRGYNPEGVLLARTLKQHRNRFVTSNFSSALYIGFDGELAAEDERHPDLCRLTSSACSREDGSPFVLWHIFDFVTEDTIHLSYRSRYLTMKHKIEDLQSRGLCGHLRIVPYIECNNMGELEAAHQHYMELGYEGTCFYGPDVKHKEGKSSPTHNGVLRIKDFIDFEYEILAVTEGEENLNEKQTNELGRSFRSSHQENKIGNSMVGSISGRVISDVFDLHDSTKRLLTKDQIVTVSPGQMSHDDRLYYFANQDQFVKRIGKGKFFPKGIKDKPRFPIHMSLRSKEDL